MTALQVCGAHFQAGAEAGNKRLRTADCCFPYFGSGRDTCVIHYITLRVLQNLVQVVIYLGKCHPFFKVHIDLLSLVPNANS